MMELDEIGKLVAVVTAMGSGSYAAVMAGLSWREKAAESRRRERERRMSELRRLVECREKCQPVLDEIFDYNSSLDHHLRLSDLTFGTDEVATRARADSAFEHFREVHRSVMMGLIEKEDLGPWVYWIHRVETRPDLRKYARACGYEAFMADLAHWTRGTAELKLLEEHCPWWPRAEGAPSPRGQARKQAG